jgi:two-component system, LytTR family, sensor kinase
VRQPLGRGSRWALILLGSTLLGVFFATQNYIAMAYLGQPVSWLRALAVALSDWYLWAAFTPLLLWVAGRLPWDRHNWPGRLGLHLLASTAFTMVHLALFAVLAPRLGDFARQYSYGYLFRAFFDLKFSSDFLTYWMILGLIHARNYYVQYRDREVQAAQLETRLAQARLDLLKMRLHPHFLFNTLHAISTLTHRRPALAERMISRLSDLLRMTLENGEAQEVPLQQELEFLQGYLEIEQMRFQDRLSLHLEIDEAALDASVPNMLLQPLVENAVRHGIARREAGGRIDILARRVNGHLELAVADNGPGLAVSSEAAFRRGVGLSHTRARLHQLYGPAHFLVLSESGSGGLQVSLSIPYRPAAERFPDGLNGVNDETAHDDRGRRALGA